MKSNQIFTVLAVVACATALTITCSRNDDLRIERPEWMTSPPIAEVKETRGREAERSIVVSSETAGSTSAIREMAEAGQLASVLKETKQTVSFRARALMDAGIAEDIASGMVKVVEEMEVAYRFMVDQKIETEQRYGCELLLAIWPEFSELIRNKEVVLNVAAFPPENWSQPKVGVAMAFDVSRGLLSYSMNLQRWSVSFEFSHTKNPRPELFKKVVEVARVDSK